LKSQNLNGALSLKKTTAGAKLDGRKNGVKKTIKFMGGHFRAVQGFKYIGTK